jgi:hypothetical protein
MVLQKIFEDPHHDSVPSVNYSNEKISSFNHPTNLNDIQQSFNDRMNFDLFYFIFKIFLKVV